MRLCFLLSLLIGVLTAGARELDETSFIAHRGESHDAPENTMPAFQMAVDRGFGFECDLYLSADKRVFSFHDKNLKRTTGLDLPCAKANWSNQLSKIDAGKWKGPQWVGTRPALLEEILPLARKGRWIYLELKTGPEIVPYLRSILLRQKMATPENTLFICFNRETCKALRSQLPTYKVYWLSGSKRKVDGKKVPVSVEYLLEGLKETGAAGIDLQFDPATQDAAFIRAIRDAGYEFHVWTVDSLDRSLQAWERGAQTITTNCAKKQLDAYRQRRTRNRK